MSRTFDWSTVPITPVKNAHDANAQEWSEHNAKRGGQTAHDVYSYTQRSIGRRLSAGFKLLSSRGT